jgi:hypothetical protein
VAVIALALGIGMNVAISPYFSYSDYQANSIHRQPNSGIGPLVEKLRLLPGSASVAQFASGLFVSENYFQVLGATAFRGLLFKAETRRR